MVVNGNHRCHTRKDLPGMLLKCKADFLIKLNFGFILFEAGFVLF